MSILEKKLGIWTADTAKAVGQLHVMKDMGFQYLAVRVVVHTATQTVPYKQAALDQLVNEASVIAFPLIAWAYVYPHLDINQQVQVINSSLPPNCTDIILDAEGEWEGTGNVLATQLINGLQGLMPNTNLHLSSFYATQLHGTFPFSAFLAGCKSFMPQSYIIGDTPVHLVLSRTVTQALPVAQAAGAKFIPTVNVPDILDPIIDTAIDGANVWLWEDSGDDVGVQGREDSWTGVITKFQQKFGT